MQETRPQNLNKYHFRAKLPTYLRIGAVVAVIGVIIAIGIGFYRGGSRSDFRMAGFPTSLSKDVTAEITNYERRESEGGIPKYYIKADKAITFADNHQELQNMYLEVYDGTVERFDKIVAEKAVYIPAEDKNFTAYMAGSVDILTRDALRIKTEQGTYTKATETAVAEEKVEFERQGVVGKAIGAVVKIAEKKLELLKDVDIQTYESPELAKANVREAHITSGYASVDQAQERIDLEHSVAINIISSTQPNAPARETDIASNRAVVFFTSQNGQNHKPKKFELFENVKIDTKEANAQPTTIQSGYALYERDIDRFELKQGVNIVTVQANNQPTNIKSTDAVYEQKDGKVFLWGGAEISQAKEYLKGDSIIAELYPTRNLKTSVVKGNAYLRQTTAERTTELTSAEVNARFDETQKIEAANALGASNAVLTPVQAVDYTKVTMFAPVAIRLTFKGEGLLDGMQTEGRTTIDLTSPNNAPDSSNKKLTADTVKTIFAADGKNIQKAEAVGNAELFVDPLRALPDNYKTTINAPRFDCEFYPTGNNAKTCVAATKTKTARVPTVQANDRGTQTLTADTLSAFFSETSRDVERFEAVGATKFTELDRNGIAGQITFTAADQVVKLRGGEPTVWDSQGRAKAPEIDWDTKNKKSYLKGGVSTTYYSQKQTGGATPFGKMDTPVFVTALAAEFDHASETGSYAGNARAWQENNYIRADKFVIYQKTGKFNAEGSVQSLIYDAKRKEKNREIQVPVYATANRMSYDRDMRLIRYDENVDIRQGTDRIVSGTAMVYLDDKNEFSKTIAETGVVITQPNRRATGDYAQYTASDEMVVLRGNPATIDDAENGSSQSSQLTVYMRENRVVSEAKTKTGTSGRTRSVYKVKNANINQLN
jgi:lipopolysaccharide export system protein LptA/lipopolysaccharide export system protein LptC